MGKTNRHIKVTLMLTAGLLILLHSIIPHHHHYNTLDHNNCSPTETHSEMPDKAKTHCHAFNNIVFENINHTSFKLNLQPNINLFCVQAFADTKTNKNKTITVYALYNFVFPKHHSLSKPTHRGPPLSC